MALVSYGSSDEDVSGDEEQPKSARPTASGAQSAAAFSISDDDEDDGGKEEDHLLDEGDLDIPGLSSRGSSLFAALPPSSAAPQERAVEYEDQDEDLSTIPPAKQYDQPAASSSSSCSALSSLVAKRGRSHGTVRIFAPRLDVQRDDDEAEMAPSTKKKFVPSQASGSSLLSFIPPPKNSVMVAPSESRKPVAGKPMVTATTRSLVPRSVTQKPVTSKEDEDSGPFFTMDRIVKSTASSSVSSLTKIQVNPNAYVPDEEAVMSMPLPGAHPRPEVAAASSSRDLLMDAEAMQKLMGRPKSKQADVEVIDVSTDELKSDAREWMSKALTANDNAPGPKCTIKGEKKRKHQITYLAAMAKEKEHELREMWAANAQTRRAAKSKYGF